MHMSGEVVSNFQILDAHSPDRVWWEFVRETTRMRHSFENEITSRHERRTLRGDDDNGQLRGARQRHELSRLEEMALPSSSVTNIIT